VDWRAVYQQWWGCAPSRPLASQYGASARRLNSAADPALRFSRSQFVIEIYPDFPRVQFASGLSGAVKVSSLTGETLMSHLASWSKT